MDKNTKFNIDEQNLRSVYLVSGDSYFKKEFINKLKNVVIKTEFDMTNYEKLDGREISLSEVLQKAESIPFFGDKRLLVVNNAPYFSEKVSDNEKNLLSNYISNPSSSSVLVFVTDKIDKRQKLVKDFKSKDMLVEISSLKPWEVDKWVKNKISSKGKKIDSKAVSTLVERTNGELPMLEKEIEKLEVFLGFKETIEYQDVVTIVSPTAENNVFQLIDKIGEKKIIESISLFRELALHEPPVKILFLVGRQFRLLMKMKSYLDDGLASSEASKRIKIHPFVGKKISEQCKNFTYDELSKAMKKVQEIDYKIKTGQLEPVFAIERLIMFFA
ncbi:DNA polymerase III subunit delta [Natranaerobius trueperi]|uniref:DNA polymerase III subunit delta n=1 Tax=Natranaerobius trueperi TaxID=759412 RepID=A0A226BVW3_9FIRM|nr:DNA polymerase III subunit delta [Natranaerobius trueperi]OWZ83133.1 DNA polymerase III subunit delta [Natranaerobius trueperi]